MTAPQILAALDAAGIEVRLTDVGDIFVKPTPPAGLVAEMRASKPELVALLRVSDSQEWELPSSEAMDAARAGRCETVYRPPVIDLAESGLGPQFRAEMLRLASLGLVILKPED